MDRITAPTPVDFRTKYTLSIKTNYEFTQALPKPPPPSFQHLNVTAQFKVAALYTLSAASFAAGMLKALNVLTPKLPDTGTCIAGSVFFGIQAMQTLKNESESHAVTQQNKRSPEPRHPLNSPASVETASAECVNPDHESDLTPIRLSPTDEPQSPPIRRSDSPSRYFR